MAGEIWLEELRCAKEVTFGTAVTPATRRIYARDVALNDTGENMFHDFSTGTMEQTREVTSSPEQIEGSLSMPVSADEMVEPALITIKGGVTPVVPSGATLTQDWVFTPGVTLDSMTLERNDAANPWRARGVRGNTFQIRGATDAENVATVGLMGLGMTQTALTGTPTQRTPSFMSGWETQISIGAWGADPEDELVTVDGWLVNWDWTINRNGQRFYGAQNNQQASQIPLGAFVVEGSFTVVASFAQSLTEIAASKAATKRMIRLVFGNNQVIESTFNKSVIVDLPGAWQGRDLGASGNGLRFYTLNYKSIYDPVNAYSHRMTLRNARATAF